LSQIVDFSGARCNFNQRDKEEPLRWLLIQAEAAMRNDGGLIQVKMAIADSLRNKRVVMIPTGSANSFNLQSLDRNDLLRQLGVTKPK
jgi:hypothetical protein